MEKKLDLDGIMGFETLMLDLKSPAVFLSIFSSSCPDQYAKHMYGIECKLRDIYNTLDTKDKEKLKLDTLSFSILARDNIPTEKYDEYLKIYEETKDLKLASTLFQRSDAFTLCRLYLDDHGIVERASEKPGFLTREQFRRLYRMVFSEMSMKTNDIVSFSFVCVNNKDRKELSEYLVKNKVNVFEHLGPLLYWLFIDEYRKVKDGVFDDVKQYIEDVKLKEFMKSDNLGNILGAINAVTVEYYNDRDELDGYFTWMNRYITGLIDT